jgi:hypothetical protein
MLFVELPVFTAQELFNDEGLRAVQAQLLANPEAGDLIQGGHGLRKLRAVLAGRGKRGGARVIYYWWPSQRVCYLVYAYAKNRQENLTPAQTRLLAAAMKEVLSDE